MAGKRKTDIDHESTPKAKKRRTAAPEGGDAKPTTVETPTDTPSKLRSILKAAESVNGNGDATPRSVRKVLFSETGTPSKADALTKGLFAGDESPLTKSRRLDSSARRKSHRRLIESVEDGDDEAAAGESELAEEILEDDEDGESGLVEAPDTPSKTPRPRGRPKGKRKERTPTPEDELPPHELYFYQNRTGGAKTSTNTLPASALLDHETYFEKIAAYQDAHAPYREQLLQHHHRAFEQWTFELSQSFSLCLYGYGSKRDLLLAFADHLHTTTTPAPTIIILNGYNPTATLRSLLTTLLTTLYPTLPLPLPTNPTTATTLLHTHLTSTPPPVPVHVLIPSIDAPPLRKSQAGLSKLLSHPRLSLTCTTDHPTFPLLWAPPLLSRFRFLYHDATTFAPYDVEVPAVDEVNALLGRSGRRVLGGAGDGVAFVLRSLPENARALFGILVAEQVLGMEAVGAERWGGGGGEEDGDGDGDGDGDEEGLLGEDEDGVGTEMGRGVGRKGRAKKGKGPKGSRDEGAQGVEYRMLYHKAVEQFVCSSEIGFRTLLKEFYDHQIVESRKDGLGTERLVVPFGKADLESLLEELV